MLAQSRTRRNKRGLQVPDMTAHFQAHFPGAAENPDFAKNPEKCCDINYLHFTVERSKFVAGRLVLPACC